MKKVLILLCLFITGCGKQDYSENFFYMDTLINVKLYNVEEKKAEEAFLKIDELYSKYELIASKYEVNSELYLVNNNMDYELSSELLELINLGINWYDESNGLLNINMGNITNQWTIFRNELIFPNNLNINTSIDNIVIDNNKIIYNEYLNIDLGSIAKGFVTEKAGDILNEMNLEYIINAGGNVKTHSESRDYKIGIKSPISNENIMIIEDKTVSVATSGGYERFIEYEGTLYHHIIDPKTNYPANYMKSVTVISDDALLSDILSTVLFLMPIEDGKEYIKDYEVSVIWFSNDDEIIKSENFKYE